MTSAVSRLLTCTIVFARLRRFFLAVVDSRVDSTTPGSQLGVQMHAYSREATLYLGLGPGVRYRMLHQSQMMWELHKYRLEPWGRPIASGRCTEDRTVGVRLELGLMSVAKPGSVHDA